MMMRDRNILIRIIPSLGCMYLSSLFTYTSFSSHYAILIFGYLLDLSALRFWLYHFKI